MKFSEILPGLLAGKRAIPARREAEYIGSTREYVRLGFGGKGRLELVVEYDAIGGRTTFVYPFRLTRRLLERGDWEFTQEQERRKR
ncbi:MAG: hypothetical protein IKW13_04820 [Thermoguttaceae bacterium]|nr:hypothetical protein [Thermoguttaceae bacterium]